MRISPLKAVAIVLPAALTVGSLGACKESGDSNAAAPSGGATTPAARSGGGSPIKGSTVLWVSASSDLTNGGEPSGKALTQKLLATL